MFEAFGSLLNDLNVSGINIFDLRQPKQFRFCSIQGFVFYLLSYMLVLSYDEVFRQKCLGSIFTGWNTIVSDCGLKPSAIIFPFLYMIGAFTFISLFKRLDWSTDAIFNNLSLLILVQAVATAGIYQLPHSTLAIQTYTLCYFLLLGLIVLVLLGTASLLGQRHMRPPGWTLKIGFGSSPGIFWLLAMYLLLGAAFYVEPFWLKSVSPGG